MHQIDASFRTKKEERLAVRRRVRRRRIMLAAGAVVVCALGIGYYFTADQWSIRYYEDEVVAIPSDTESLPEDAAIYVPAIVDLPGDPMIISVGRGQNAPKVRSVPKPSDLVVPGISPHVNVLADTMVSSSERFMTTIPSSQEDFAFFQSQRTAAIAASTELPKQVKSQPAAAPPDTASGANADAVESGGNVGTGGDGGAVSSNFKKTGIENTTSIALVTSEADRYKPTEDIFVKVLTARSLESLVTEHRFPPDDAKKAQDALKTVFKRDALEPGFVVALRGLRDQQNGPLQLMQVAVYANQTYVGALSRDPDGTFVAATDPWVSDDLFNYSGEVADVGPQRQYRLLDAIYSTAARNQVPTSTIGEAIMYLSRGHDLNSFATPDDRFVLVYSNTPRDSTDSAGSVLYVAVQGAENSFECYVYRQANGNFGCASGGSLSLASGMTMPVNGVMTSTFGPRKDPVSGKIRLHKGVDWSAPMGTPVVAAFDGKISFEGSTGEYGKMVHVSHSGGRETRYGHLDGFADDVEVGDTVKAGEVIGYVGNTGLSTGPHLYFELREGGNAVDPLASSEVVSDDSAVGKLTDRIIRVESAGNAKAKNPLSSATGLGQFIDSTWMRLMRTYRPDLAQSMSRDDLLALRFDPTISRQMVLNLAREGEAYLRAHGHAITAGRLYLCHFLGMDGADLVLSSAADAPLGDLLGQRVIDANPFLSGKDVGWIIGWAEHKMDGSSRRESTKKTEPASPEFLQYKQAIAQIVQQTADIL